MKKCRLCNKPMTGVPVGFICGDCARKIALFGGKAAIGAATAAAAITAVKAKKAGNRLYDKMEMKKMGLPSDFADLEDEE